MLNPVQIKAIVDKTIARYSEIEHREWNGQRYGMTQTEMWQEASECAPYQWREIIRVLAQGGDYYSIEWPTTWLQELRA
jgi:hypothetical protein